VLCSAFFAPCHWPKSLIDKFPPNRAGTLFSAEENSEKYKRQQREHSQELVLMSALIFILTFFMSALIV
jgi:hypothetical protein